MYFWHTGILTRNIEETIAFLCALHGGGRDKWTVFDVEFKDDEMLTGDGGKLRVAMGRAGGVVHELIEPLDDKSYQARRLESRGPGVCHSAYVCETGLNETLAALIAAGGRVVWEARHGDEHCVYVESGGTVLEIINLCPFMPEEE
jgi:catechol 2,3-dioxygenase-like lactoylglutathione lyase family enzyme